jgi:hypothetical protein
MMHDQQEVVDRFRRVLVREVSSRYPQKQSASFTVADIYHELVPFQTRGDELGVASVLDYEEALLRLLAGQEGLLELEAIADRHKLQQHLHSRSPGPGLIHDFLAAGVQISLPEEERLPAEEEGSSAEEARSSGEEERSPAAEVRSPVTEEGFPTEVERSPAEGERSPVEEEGSPAGDEKKDLPWFENCPSCRDPVPEKVRVNFCPLCGCDLRRVPCPSCGETLELNWRFCIACGVEVKSRKDQTDPH